MRTWFSGVVFLLLALVCPVRAFAAVQVAVPPPASAAMARPAAAAPPVTVKPARSIEILGRQLQWQTTRGTATNGETSKVHTLKFFGRSNAAGERSERALSLGATKSDSAINRSLTYSSVRPKVTAEANAATAGIPAKLSINLSSKKTTDASGVSTHSASFVLDSEKSSAKTGEIVSRHLERHLGASPAADVARVEPSATPVATREEARATKPAAVEHEPEANTLEPAVQAAPATVRVNGYLRNGKMVQGYERRAPTKSEQPSVAPSVQAPAKKKAPRLP